jgi:hypothetical protein
LVACCQAAPASNGISPATVIVSQCEYLIHLSTCSKVARHAVVTECVRNSDGQPKKPSAHSPKDAWLRLPRCWKLMCAYVLRSRSETCLSTASCHPASHPLVSERDHPVPLRFESLNISRKRLGTKHEGPVARQASGSTPIETLKRTTPIALAQ